MDILVTGSAGFIGFHLARLLLSQGHRVHGVDGMTDYYDVALKRRRHAILMQDPNFSASEIMLENAPALTRVAAAFGPEVIVHLAAQAGVRHSLTHPRAYLDANITGTFNVTEVARAEGVRHLVMASSSSVYGAQTQMPFHEGMRIDTPMTIYGATKKAAEDMGHVTAHLHGVPVTMFRFFTVYGPWGRPDMALFKFAEAMSEGRAIDVHNGGEMARDFTYVDDLVRAITLLIDVAPPRLDARPDMPVTGDSLSPVAPFRVVNIGNAQPVPLMDFISALEEAMGIPALRNMLPAQPGEVPVTWADTSLLHRLTGYRPQTDHREGVARFVDWWTAWRDDGARQVG